MKIIKEQDKKKDVAVIEDYEIHLKKFIEISSQQGKPLSQKKLKGYGLPSASYFYRNYPDSHVNTYVEFCSVLGFIPNRFKTKEQVISHIIEKRNKLNRNLQLSDFENGNDVHVTRSIINRIWGTFNNMQIELGYEINQENMQTKQRPIEELVNDLRKLCEHILETENRNIISYRDIDECSWCLNSVTYFKLFKKHLNLTPAEYIDSIGYKSNPCGMGLNHTFSDGERITSQYEFNVSTFLRDKNVKYIRNVKYNTFIEGYSKGKDCDYVIYVNDLVWHVEIAGMINDKRIDVANPSSVTDKIHRKYLEDIYEKEEMFKKEELNYKILYPSMIAAGNLEEAFNFLT